MSTKKTRKRIRRRLKNVTRLDEAGLGARLFLEVIRRIHPHFQLLPAVRYSDKSTIIAEVASSTEYEIVPPSAHGETVSIVRDRFASLVIRRFRDVIACGQASAILVDGTIALPDHYVQQAKRVVADGEFLIWHGDDDRGFLCNVRRASEHRRGISLFGTGTFNWYHWLIEQLPAAYLSEKLGGEFSKLPFVVPETVYDLPSFKDSLSLFAGDRAVETISVEPCHFDQLYVVDNPVQEPFNMSTGHWPDATDYGFNSTVMRDYRATILDRLMIKVRLPRRRIFLARAHGRRSYNQEEVVAIASDMGFEVVYPEMMTFAEQVQMMHDAAVVIGPSGASFANTLFCQPGTHLLSWLIPEYKGFCSYCNLATITGSHIRYLFTPTDMPIASTREAFSVCYKLDLGEFKVALQDTLADQLGSKP